MGRVRGRATSYLGLRVDRHGLAVTCALVVDVSEHELTVVQVMLHPVQKTLQ